MINSFVARLTGGYAVTMLVTLALFGAVTYLGLSRTLDSQLDTGLLAIARSESAYAVDHGRELHVHDSSRLANTSGLHHHVQITTLDGTVLAFSQNVEGPPLPLDPTALAANGAGQTAFRSFGYDQLPHRMLYYPLPHDGTVYSLQVAVSREYLDLVQRRLLQVLAVIGSFALGAATLSGYGLAQRAIAPIRRITETAAAIEEANLGRRIPSSGPDDELARLTRVLNGMLDRLDRAFASRRRFTSDAAHELRSPLTILRTNLELALRRPRSVEEYQEVLQSNLEEVERLITLTNDLLTLAQGDDGPHELRRVPVALDDLVLETVERHQGHAQARGIRLETDLAVAGPPLALDRDRIVQLLDNLLSNALRYTPAGKRVTVRTWQEADETLLAVIDEGIGVAPAEQERIFERFYRSDSARSRAAGGTGLGLSISRLIALQHGGRITLSSEPGQGSRFLVALPNDVAQRS